VLAILTTHPIQYQVPLWQALARDGQVPFEVWYLTSHAVQPSRDPQFGKDFAWDLDMLAGYPHRFLDVAAGATPGSFFGCRLTEKLRDRIRRAGVRALWIQGWQVLGYWQAVWEAKAAGAEVWLRGESNDLAPVPWWKTPIKKVVLGALFKRVDRFLYIGSANRRLYENFGVSSERLYPAPYAVDNERFRRQADSVRGQRSEIRRQWNIAEDAYCILFCGKFIPKKRPMDLIDAARLLLAKPSAKAAAGLTSSHLPLGNPHLLFVGSGELGAEMRAACNIVFDAETGKRTEDAGQRTEDRTEKSEPNFDLRASNSGKPAASFAGFLNQKEISRAYVAADVLVLPSDYGETWGLVVNEAMASGLPFVVSDHCGCAEDLAMQGARFGAGSIHELASILSRFPANARIESKVGPVTSLNYTVATVGNLFSMGGTQR
jgi:glycosyltransferase involved in cell wall biosynthesis